MKLLITTNRALSVYDTEREELTHIHESFGEYYGLAYDDDSIYLAARGPWDLVIGGIVLKFDYDLQFQDRLDSGDLMLRNMHQFAVASNSDLWVTCTWDNFIAVYRSGSSSWGRIHPRPGYVGADFNHLNSIFFEGQSVYLVANNAKQEGKASEIWEFLPDNETNVYPLDGRDAHNVWRDPKTGKLMSLVGARDETKTWGSIMDIEGKSYLDFDYFPRGICGNDDRRFLGATTRTRRENRKFQESYLMEYDSDWNLLKEHKLGQLGAVYEVRMPGHSDFAYPTFKGRKLTD